MSDSIGAKDVEAYADAVIAAGGPPDELRAALAYRKAMSEFHVAVEGFRGWLDGNP